MLKPGAADANRTSRESVVVKAIYGAMLLCLVSTLASAGTWTADLVDAGCFQSEERNVNPDDITVPGARDLDFEIRACYPRAKKSRTFMVVLSSGEIFSLDSAGNSQAARLVDAAGKRPKGHADFPVKVTGSISKDRIDVNSMTVSSSGI